MGCLKLFEDLCFAVHLFYGVFADVSFSGIVIQVPSFWVDPYVLAPSMGFVYPARQKIVEVQDHGCVGSDLEFW